MAWNQATRARAAESRQFNQVLREHEILEVCLRHLKDHVLACGSAEEVARQCRAHGLRVSGPAIRRLIRRRCGAGSEGRAKFASLAVKLRPRVLAGGSLFEESDELQPCL